MRGILDDMAIIGLILVAACATAFFIGVAVGLFRLGMGLTG